MILVQALEEFPYNNEFVGRNFNAGEVIQLVLRNKQGQWLPERWVMMVMVHELAHCKQMNHSKAFWKVRDAYAADLRELWGKGYTGEGLWGRGRDLETGHIHSGSIEVGDVPEHLCGGTYGRKRGKRKRGGNASEALSYAERKQRRILKKFGAGGQALGSDDNIKVKLEGGVPKKGKPRVAGSARGRELRAAAALARFETVKKEEVVIKSEDSDSDTDYEYEDISRDEAAIDVDGKKLLDHKGRGLVKICEGEDDSDGNARREMEEMLDFEDNSRSKQPKEKSKDSSPTRARRERLPNARNTLPDPSSLSRASSHVVHLDEIYKRRPESNAAKQPDQSSNRTTDRPSAKPQTECTVCSLKNQPGSVICMACSNVLNPHLTKNHWKCQSQPCKESKYSNYDDLGVV